MRFREEKVALSGDIEAMFNQVAVLEADQVALRFLWRQSPNQRSKSTTVRASHIRSEMFSNLFQLCLVEKCRR